MARGDQPASHWRRVAGRLGDGLHAPAPGSTARLPTGPRSALVTADAAAWRSWPPARTWPQVPVITQRDQATEDAVRVTCVCLARPHLLVLLWRSPLSEVLRLN